MREMVRSMKSIVPIWAVLWRKENSLGWLSGNMMDIVDKRFYLAPLLGRKSGMLFHRGNPPRFYLTLTQTKATTVIAALAPWGLALSVAV